MLFIFRINQEYLKTVKPIFQKSCFDCHGNTTVYPWYYKVPGVKQLIDNDIDEVKQVDKWIRESKEILK